MNNYLTTNYDLNNPELVSVIDELPLWSAPFGLRLLEKIKYRKNITALDIGSGLGFPLLEVAMRLGNSCKLYAIDPWEAAVERVKSKIKVYGITNVEIITGVAEKIPLADDSVDLIFSNNGLNNVNDLTGVLGECNRISRMGAQLVFSYNTDKTMGEFYTVFEELLRAKNMTKEIVLMKDHINQKRKPIEEYVRLLNKYGFKINDINEHKFDFRFVDGTTVFNHFLIRLAFIESWKALIPEKMQKEFFDELVEKLNQSAQRNKILTLTIPFAIVNCEKIKK